jgi:hypothetical protein
MPMVVTWEPIWGLRLIICKAVGIGCREWGIECDGIAVYSNNESVLIIQFEAKISERGRLSMPRQLLSGKQEIVWLSTREGYLEVASITKSHTINEASEVVNAIETECAVVGNEAIDGDSGSKRTMG